MISLIAGAAVIGWPKLQQWQQQHNDGDSERVQLTLSVAPKGSPEAPRQQTPAADNSFEQRLAQARAALEAEQQQTAPPASPQPAEQPSATSPAQTQQLATAPIKQKAPEPSESEQTASEKLVLQLPPVQEQAPPNPAPVKPQAATSYYGDGQALLQWPSKGYTLQMLGARKAGSVGPFIASMPHQEQLKRFYTLYKEKPWYVVIYGRYPDRATAMEAIGNLPSELRARRPWARSISGVQEDIRQGAK